MSMLTSSDLVFLLGDRFAPAPGFLGTKHEVIGRGATVDAGPLAEAAIAAALLGLERDGHLHLTREPKKEMLGLRNTHTVRAERTPTATAPPDTLEAALLAAVGDGRDEIDEVVYRWLDEDRTVPALAVLDLVRDGLVARGLVARTETKAKKLFWTQTTVHHAPTAETTAALEAAPADALLALLADAGGRADLRETLRTEIGQGFSRRTDHGDYDVE
jgi:hypothetical protein